MGSCNLIGVTDTDNIGTQNIIYTLKYSFVKDVYKIKLHIDMHLRIPLLLPNSCTNMQYFLQNL